MRERLFGARSSKRCGNRDPGLQNYSTAHSLINAPVSKEFFRIALGPRSLDAKIAT